MINAEIHSDDHDDPKNFVKSQLKSTDHAFLYSYNLV